MAAAGGGALSEVVTSGEGAGQFDDPSYMESLFNAASLSQIHQQMSYMKVSQVIMTSDFLFTQKCRANHDLKQ